MSNKFIGALLVSMAATAVMAADTPAAAAPASADKTAAHMCQNDSCKGKADCKGYGNDSCKGKNGCKSMGHMNAKTKDECAKAHGKWTVTK